MRRRFLAALIGAALTALPAAAQTAAGEASLRAPRGVLEAVLPGGRVVGGTQLAGAILDLGPTYGAVRIAGIAPDPLDRQGEILLYDLRWRNAASGEWDVSTCAPGPDGTRATVMLEIGGGVVPHCTGANQAKCVRFGYAPWRSAADGRSLAPFWAACMRMLPAEYAGDGRFHTRNGTPIDFWDVAGINRPEAETHQAFEAGWSPEGAVCVAHPRVPEVTDRAQLPAAAPRLAEAGLIGPEGCTEDRARALGALLFNRSTER